MKKQIKASSNVAKYTINFGDGNAAASRGMEYESNCSISGKLSSDELAYIAAYYIDWLDDGFTDTDVYECLESDYGENYEAEVLNRSISDLKDDLSSKDIGDGSCIVYEILKNGNQIYYDEYAEEVVLENSDDEDDYDDEFDW